MSFYCRVKLNLYSKNVLKYLESKFKSLVFKLFIIIIIIIIIVITIVISMFCFRFDNGYTSIRRLKLSRCSRANVVLRSSQLSKEETKAFANFDLSNENAALWVQYLVRGLSGD